MRMKISSSIVLLLAPLATFASAAPSWVENTLYASGKMNTVLAVVMVIVVGILIWLFKLDRRIKRMENKK